MRIVKSTKAEVKAAKSIDKMTTTELFNFIHDAHKDEFEPDGSKSWQTTFCEISGIPKSEADACYWHNKPIKNNPEANKKIIDYLKLKDIDACDSIKSSKQLSANDQALKHIKAAIDILGKSGNKDEITKDSIANLGVVMFDLQDRRK